MRVILLFLVLATGLELLFVRLRMLGDWSRTVPETLTLWLVTSILYTVSAWLAARRGEPANRLVLLLILFAGAAFRLTLWPVFPSLSDDVYRYRWEGRLQSAGGNPYLVRPRDPSWTLLIDRTFPHIVAPDFRTVYGPVIELEERGAVWMASHLSSDPFTQVFWMKTPAALADLGCIAALLALLRANRLPAQLVLLYVWCPLPIIEFWAEGHNDALLLLFLLLALLYARREQWFASFACLTLATFTKLWPLLLFATWIGWPPRRWKPALIAIPVGLLLFAPYWSGVVENLRFASGFVGGWRNSDSLFGAVLWLTGDLQQAKYLTFGLIALATLAVTWREPRLERATLFVVIALLLLSSNCHPWYLTWVAVLLPFCLSTPLLLWIALAPLAYIVVIQFAFLGIWDGVNPFRWWIYAPVFAFSAALALYRLRKSAKSPVLLQS